MSVPEHPNDPTPIPENNSQDNPTVSPITSFTNSADNTLSAESDSGITNSPSASPLKSIGPYRFVRKLGEGGMGQVWLAEQTSPLQRLVAIKLVRAGLVDEVHLQRFQSERQALARMSHPTIAKVYDAGTTPEGLPYFVMEYVPGIPITLYCDQKRLSIRQRLELFLKVCEGVHHAHQKAVIHRDLKPANILVVEIDGVPAPRIIDFGIAKAVGDGDPLATMVTKLGTVIGTLEYMSPEQAESAGIDIDTRSDIYSLGAMLYEILAGSTPLASAHTGNTAYLETLRKIREDEPPAPSRRSSASREFLPQTSERRQTDAAHLPKILQGELDWIVMKALEKDRARRYETANGFAQDIGRYLTGDPVEAGPPSASYRLKKFASKNKLLIGTIAAFATLLVLGVVISTWQAIRARRAERTAKIQRDRADSEAATAVAVSDFLQKSLLSQASAQQQSGIDAPPDPDIKVRTLLDRAAANLDGKFPDKPLVEAGVRVTIASTYRDLNLLPQAAEQFRKAYDLSLKATGPESRETLTRLQDLAVITQDQGDRVGAMKMHEEGVEKMTRVLGPDDPQTLTAMQSLGVSYLFSGDYAKSEELLKKVFAAQIRKFGMDNIDTLNTSDSLVTLYRQEHKYQDAETLIPPALESYRRLYGPNHPFYLREIYASAIIKIGEEKYAEAEPLLKQVLDGNTKLLGPDHLDTLSTQMELAKLYRLEGKFAEAIALQEKTYASYVRVMGADHPDTIVAEDILGMIYGYAGELAKAEALYKDSLSRHLRLLGPLDMETLGSIGNLAYFYELHGRFAEAVPLEITLKEGATKKFGPTHPTSLGAASTLGRDYLMLHQYAKAEPVLRDTLAQMTKAQPDSWKRYNLESLLGASLLGQRKFAEAEPLLVSGYEGMQPRLAKIPVPGKVYLTEAGERLPQLYKAWAKPEKAAQWSVTLKNATPPNSAAAPASK
jgi:eukaryotic-like serine/threonine-protein kinase